MRANYCVFFSADKSADAQSRTRLSPIVVTGIFYQMFLIRMAGWSRWAKDSLIADTAEFRKDRAVPAHRTKTPPPASLKQRLVYPARMTIAAVLALLAARLLGLPEAYWASITALIVVQSDFGSSLLLSWQRLAGTALGASLGALLAETLGRSVLVFGLGVLAVGLVAALLRLDRPANRFAAIALAIVLLIARAEPAWVVALHRFIEVSTGILIGLLVSAVWPEPQASQSAT